jgi:hypothetical protein
LCAGLERGTLMGQAVPCPRMPAIVEGFRAQRPT